MLRFGLLVPTLAESQPWGMEHLRAAARYGDAGDFEVLWVGDHLLYRLPILDSTVAVSVLGALTSTVCVGTNVLQLPLRRPIDVAKSFSTLSHLTNGRVILGIGVGGEFEAEWRAAGVAMKGRGSRCDEALDALRWHWAGIEKQGKHFYSPAVEVAPPPVGGTVPIWVGGRSHAAVERAARCDGSLNMFVSAQRYVDIREQILELRGGDVGRFRFGLEIMTRIGSSRDEARSALQGALRRMNLDADALERYNAFGTPQDVAETVIAFARAGVDHISFYMPGPGWADQVDQLVGGVLPLVREATREAA